MTREHAAAVVAILNAGYPRDAIEGDTRDVWIHEIARLHRGDAAIEAARTIIRQGDRFPTMQAFLATYRQTAARLAVGREIEPADDSVPPPPETLAWYAERNEKGWGDVLRDVT